MAAERILEESVLGQVQDAFAGLKEPVEILFFGSSDNSDYCADELQLLREVVALHAGLHLSTYDLDANRDFAERFQVDRAPTVVVVAKEGSGLTDLGIRFAGIPSGHEFGTLINDILLVSGRDSGLSEKTREYLRSLNKPLLLQVFVTPTCPYCPRAVLLAHQMAMENPRMIRAEGVEAMEFPELADRFHVSGVPQTVINAGAGTVVGAVPEQNLLAEITRALQN